MRYFLGVDGGASKTHALIVDEKGRAVGFGQAGGGNHQVRGLESALDEVETAVLIGLGQMNLPANAVECGYYCLAGADLPEDYSMLQSAVEQLGLSRTAVIDNDTMAALRAGLSRSWGVVVICGTGFNGAGRAPDGREVRMPGLGPISGDISGGSAIAYDAIGGVMRAWDGRGKPTQLRDPMLSMFGAADEEALIAKLYHEEIPHQALLNVVPLVFEMAMVGDEAAADILIKTGTEVGVTANAIIQRLDLQTTDVEVVLGGSVFKGRGPLLLDTVQQVILQQVPKAKLVQLHHEPVLGAALLGLEHSTISVTSAVWSTLEATLRNLPGYPASNQ